MEMRNLTFEEKIFLSDRISAAVESLDADYHQAQNEAAYHREYYYDCREKAQAFHEQRMILLEAQNKLWHDDKEAF